MTCFLIKIKSVAKLSATYCIHVKLTKFYLITHFQPLRSLQIFLAKRVPNLGDFSTFLSEENMLMHATTNNTQV